MTTWHYHELKMMYDFRSKHINIQLMLGLYMLHNMYGDILTTSKEILI